jgi:hypothetical protein
MIKEENLLYRLVIPEYPMNVQISAARRAKYYSVIAGTGRVTKLPKWVNKHKSHYDTLGYILDDNGEKIVANSRSAGTPKFASINGQVFYSQSGGPYLRAKIVKYLHEYLTEKTQDVPVFNKYPIIITLNWVLPYSHKTMDNTNMSFAYMKVFEDVLTNTGKIIDDEVRYVSGGFPYYSPTRELKDRKLIFSMYHDDRLEMQQLQLL